MSTSLDTNYLPKVPVKTNLDTDMSTAHEVSMKQMSIWKELRKYHIFHF